MIDPDTPEVYAAPLGEQLPAFLDQHRAELAACLDGLTEAEARVRLVPSKTTLLGLVKHGVFVERVWFGQAVTGASRTELGVAETPDGSFDLADDDTIASVREAYAAAVRDSREAVRGLGPDDVLTGNKRGPLPLRWVQLHMLRELAKHGGHAEILREIVLTSRDDQRV